MSENDPDLDALRQVAAGGPARQRGIAELFERYEGKFRRYYRRHRLSDYDAQDIVQDVFVKIVRACDGESFREETKPAIWLWTIARNTMLYHFRKTGRQPETSEIDGTDADATAVVADKAKGIDNLEDCVGDALDRFEHDQPERGSTIRLATIEGWSTKELAEVLDRSLGATREFLSQCRKQFAPYVAPCRDYLAPEGA